MLVLEKIVKSYNIGNQKVKVINNLSLKLPDIGFFGIKGKSGSGKSTLLNIISGLEKCDTGFVLFNGKMINEDFLREEVSIISQNNELLSYLNVKDNIIIGSKIGGLKYSLKTLDKLVERLELKKHLNKMPNQLSVGQMKRVSIARGVLKDSSIILCDEPTGALHAKQSNEIMQILKETSKTRLVIIVSHEYNLLEKYCDEVFILEEGTIKNKVMNKEVVEIKKRESRRYSLFYYMIKRIYNDKYILLFMMIFEAIIIISLFMIISGINGIEKKLDDDYLHSVEKNLIKIEQYDSHFFEEPLKEGFSYDYILSFGFLSIDGEMKFLPKNCEHVELYEGSLPANNNQILVSYPLKDMIDKEIEYRYNNQIISLKIVGVLQKDFFNEKIIYFHNDFKNRIPDYINKSIVVLEGENTLELYEELSKDYIVYNDPIERKNSYLSLSKYARLVAWIFFFISLLSSFFLLYIIYQTLDIKRKHDNALLLMLGLSVYQLFKLNLIESVFVGVLLSGIGNCLSIVVYYYLNNVLDIESIVLFKLEIDSFYFLFISIIYILINVISSYLPIKKINAGHLIMMLREEE